MRYKTKVYMYTYIYKYYKCEMSIVNHDQVKTS